MTQKITTFLMFDGQAERAVDFYVSLFRNSNIGDIKRYGAGEAGREGSVMWTTFRLEGQPFMAIDSPVKRDFGFTPSISQFVVCESEAEIEEMFAQLARGGQVMMPLNNYPHNARFAWVSDRFGVSWQLSLPAR